VIQELGLRDMESGRRHGIDAIHWFRRTARKYAVYAVVMPPRAMVKFRIVDADGVTHFEETVESTAPSGIACTQPVEGLPEGAPLALVVLNEYSAHMKRVPIPLKSKGP
jgi:hypothetical protein